MKEVTFKIDMTEFATKEDLAKLDDTLHLFMEKVITALDRIESTMATKEDLNELRHNHGTRIEILEDEVQSINKKLEHAHIGV